MTVFKIAFCSTQICEQFSVCKTDWFQSFLDEMEAQLEHRMIEIAAIAASRANSEQTGALCDLSWGQLALKKRP